MSSITDLVVQQLNRAQHAVTNFPHNLLTTFGGFEYLRRLPEDSE
jgi:hypothetical protein